MYLFSINSEVKNVLKSAGTSCFKDSISIIFSPCLIFLFNISLLVIILPSKILVKSVVS